MKTFWTGVGGWADNQFPDGTVEFTSPSGRTYTTKPGGSQFFPILATPTGEVAIRTVTAEQGQGRGLMMPRRKRTRAEELQDRITAERCTNEARIAEERRQYESWLAATHRDAASKSGVSAPGRPDHSLAGAAAERAGRGLPF